MVRAQFASLSLWLVKDDSSFIPFVLSVTKVGSTLDGSRLGAVS